MGHELKKISKSGIEEALAKTELYRFFERAGRSGVHLSRHPRD